MAELFGFRITKKTDEKDIVSFTSPSSDDGTIEIPGGGFYSSVLDTDGRDRADIDLISKMAVDDPSSSGNPVPLNADDYAKILQNAFAGSLTDQRVAA